ncbi:MAG TPA: beta-galactosidase, partial [Pyrinomonadaceae bacterium]|nr:beta-galactosidase [Pyrinomonadaceae bacterium]
MNKLKCLLILMIMLLLFPASAHQQKSVGGSTFVKNDITYSTAVVTPHVPWATKLPQGPIKSFFIPSIQYGRDMVELMQRLALDPTTDSIDSSWDINCWGIGDYYGHEYRGDRDDFRTVYGYVEKDLTLNASYEVMLIPGINGWSRMTRATRDAILRRVKEGAGLVLLHPFIGDVKGHPFKGDEPVGDERIWELSPLTGVADDTVNERGYPEVNRDAITKGKWEPGDPHFITEGLPLELLPEGTIGGSFYRYKSKGDVLIKSGTHPIMSVSNYGKGRVVAMAYLAEGFTPQSIDPIENKIYWDYWEYQYSLLARALLWAAGRNTPVRILSLTAGEAGLKVSLNASSQQAARIEVNGHNEFGQALGSTTVDKVLSSGANTIEIPASKLQPSFGWPGGRQIFNVIIRDANDNSTLNWGAATFTTPKRAMMTSTKTAVDVYKRGETLSAVLRASGNLNGLQMRMQVWDDLGRLLGDISAPARGERTFTFPLTNFLGKFALVRGELVDDRGSIVDQVRAKPAMVVQDTRRAKEYTALVSFGGTKHYLQDAQMKMVRAAAADTGFTWSNDVDNSLNIPRGTFGVYWYDRGPTTPEAMERAIADYQKTGDFEALGYLTKKELYKRTGDKKFLQRTPSFNDPAVLKNLADIVRASARNKARYNMDYYFVGDEGSLTSYGDAVDFDWSPHTLANFRIWLQQQYGNLTALNNEWHTSFSDWNSVVPHTTEEARKTRNFAPWADHRTFMEITFAKAYQTARDAAIEGDPGAHIAVSGTQATNAYNGADWSRLDSVIDDFLSYDGGNQWDMHRSFAKPNAMIGFWTGYGSHGLAVQNAIWTAAIHNVLHPNIFWMYSFLNPDFTHSASARDMGKAFSSLRFEGVGKLLMESVRQQDGIAVYYSMPSIHAASILGYHQRSSDDDDEVTDKARLSFSANRDGWVKTIKDLGLQFDF